MFFKRFKQDDTLPHRKSPAVKKVSELIDKRSHKQKKYISLMLVPSYTTGRTRSLRIPRGLFHGVVASMLVVSAVVAGFYLRSNHFYRMAQELYVAREEIAETFAEFQYEAEIVQSDLIDTMIQVYERYSEIQQNVQSQLDSQARDHQTNLDSLREQVDEFEQMIRDLEADQQAVLEGLSARAELIPPVAGILNQLEASRKTLLSASVLHSADEVYTTAPKTASMGFLSTGNTYAISEAELQTRITSLMDELRLQRKLLEDLETHRGRMGAYLRNYPTIWPVRGNISSGFGWRTNPMGGRGSEHHDGVDIPARTGTSIRAAGGGTVIYAGWQNGYGNTVIINHGSGITTVYAHNSHNHVEVGQRVERGEIIANVGSTGRSTGPHLHFEVRVNGSAVNPRTFMVEFY